LVFQKIKYGCIYLAFFGSLEGKGGGKRFWKKGRKRGVWEGRTVEGSFFFIIQNYPNLVELKNCIGERFWRIYMNYSNSIYVVIRFSKLKLY
jgi:hypothetical protein